MAKMTKAQLGAMGKKIMTEAKKVRKANPKMKWTDCVKKGAKKIKK